MSSGFSPSAQVCPTSQAILLQAIVDKIRAEIAAFQTGVTCIISDQPWPSVEPNDNLFCTVCPRDSSFASEDPVGGGNQGIIENSNILVSVFSNVKLDQLERENSAFLDPDRGLLLLKAQILQCLAGQQIYHINDPPDDPTPLLIEYMRPVRAMHPPSKQHDDDFSSFSILFEAPFYWALV